MRTKKIISQLKKALREEHLYSSEELEYMRQQLNFMQNSILKAQHKDYRGFGKK